MSEKQGNSPNVPDETVIEMSESYEALELFSIRRLGPVNYFLNFNRIRLEIPLLNDVIQERDSFHMEFTILPFYKQFVLQQIGEYPGVLMRRWRERKRHTNTETTTSIDRTPVMFIFMLFFSPPAHKLMIAQVQVEAWQAD